MKYLVKERSFLGLHEDGFHRINYREWGSSKRSDTVICVHGLTRHSRDFDVLAKFLIRKFHIICPDIAGRGESSWFEQAKHYNFIQYAADMNALIARSGVERVHWVGTSMGGLIGMVLAAMPNSPIASLVINDVGPQIRHAELLRMGSHIGRNMAFGSIEEVDAYFRDIYSGFGPMTDRQWRDMVENSVRHLENGTYILHYDPKIGDAFRRAYSFMHFNLWKYWDQISCPVLIIRGEKSSFLTRKTAEEMTRRGPEAELIEISNVGHTPMLMSRKEVNVVMKFLQSS